jgi:hypothetical protein
MFALIETKGATHIAIHIPAERAHESLPAIARMLEKNATFIEQSWREQKTVKPVMTISLGDEFEISNSDGEVLKIASDANVIGEEFIAESLGVFASNKEYRAKKEAEIAGLRREIDSLKLQNEKLQSALSAATSQEEAA